MWTRDSAPSGAPNPTPTPNANAAAAVPHSSTSASPSRGMTVIGETMRVEGTLISQEEVHVAGEIKGRLEVDNKLTLGPKSKVEAAVKAREATIAGSVKGNVEAVGRLILRSGANLIGDVKTSGIVIEDGAYFKGGIDIARTAS